MNATMTETPFHGQPARAEAASLPYGSARPAVSRTAMWTGRVLSALAVMFLAFDASVKVLALPLAIEATTQLGYPAGILVGLGVLQVICLALYLMPRTSVLGAILWTGYLGGAIATHVRVGSPLFSHILFPIYVAAFLWAGLWLRDWRVKALLASPSRQ